MKNTLIVIAIIGFVLLLVFDYRVPFRMQIGGPWSIGFGSSSQYPEKIEVGDNPIFSYEKLKTIQDSTRFLADPFFIKVRDTFYIFFEHQMTEGNAKIGLMTSVDGKEYQYRGTVLKEPFHLSYPQVFMHKKNYYMLPESQGCNAVVLYKADHFPFGWKVFDTLLPNLKLKDPSIYVSDTLNFLVGSDSQLNLKMYTADSLFGKWKLHNKKPVAMSGSEVRPGGRIYADKKGFLIPIQNNTNGYGFGLSLYRLQFKDGSYTTEREKSFFLKRQDDIKEFNAGMHQFDIQRTNKGYYYVYDGNRLASSEKEWNVLASLKINYCDLKDYINHQIE